MNAMKKSPATFQRTLFVFIDRLITIDVDIVIVEGFYALLASLFFNLVQSGLPNGFKLVKAAIRYLLDIISLPKLPQKLTSRLAELLLRTIRASFTSESAFLSSVEDKALADRL